MDGSLRGAARRLLRVSSTPSRTRLRSSPALPRESIRSPTRLISFDGRNKVVMSEYEFPTMAHIWLAQRPRGAEIQFLDGVNNTVPTECYERAIDERTRIVPLTHVSFVNGFRSDVAAIAKSPTPMALWFFSMAIRIAEPARWM